MIPKLAVFGDVLLDRYDYCENRENPESSAPCHRVKETKFLSGGAGNVAAILSKLGASVTLFGIVGNDEHGKILCQEIEKLGVNSKLLSDNQIKTIVKQRILSASDGRYHGRLDFGDHKLEIDLIKSLSSEVVKKILLNLSTDFDAIIISDYAKGFITLELMNEIKKMKIPFYVDPKQDVDIYRGATLIKPNRKELVQFMGVGDEIQNAKELARRLNALVLLTRGADGMYLTDETGDSFSVPAHKIDVVDVTGCGDAAISALVFYRTLGKSWQDSIELANRAAAINAMHVGCYQPTREEIEKFQ